MRSAPCASAPSHSLHAMPPRITRNSDSHEPRIEPWLTFMLLAASFTLELCRRSRESLREWNNKPNILRVTKQSGLDLEKESRSSRGGAFFLTSLFIELIELRMLASTRKQGAISGYLGSGNIPRAQNRQQSMLDEVFTIGIPRRLRVIEGGYKAVLIVLPQFIGQGLIFGQFNRLVHLACVSAHRAGRVTYPFIAAVADSST